MADISKINVNSTVYNLKDSRIPALPNSTTTYLRGDGTWVAPSVTASTSNADVSDEDTYLLITPSSGGGGTVNLQAKTNIAPTTSSQTITADSGYDGLSSVQINPIPSQYIVPSGNKAITENGTGIDVSAYATVSVNVGGMNVQCYHGYGTSTSTSYVATSVTLTVAKTGTYKVSWVGWRSNGSGTFGSQLYKNDSAVGSANTTFTGSYGQSITLTNQSFNKGDELVVWARSRGSSYTMYVANLCIEQTA